MALENERRFLLSGFPDISAGVQATKIEQGYFEMPAPSDSFRVRIMGGESSVLTLKDGRGISREEDEDSISLLLAQKLLNKCHHRLTKLRIVYQGWEIDIFGDVLSGIILAEFQFKGKSIKLKIPKWLKPFIIREVTDSLTNLHLARLASDLQGTDLSATSYLESHFKNIRKVVFTGGPCSGKSTIMEKFKKIYPECHFVPEVATIVISQLGILPGRDALSQKRFQRTIYRTQKHFEATSIQYAISENKKAVAFDRGAPDSAAYMSGGVSEFEEMANTKLEEEFKCYDAVCYLSVPPKDIYDLNKSNNSARREEHEQAEDLGQKIYNVWSGHSSFFPAISEVWDDKVMIADFALGLNPKIKTYKLVR